MHHLQHIAELGHILMAMGVKHVIIAPGSRNAPLIQLFTSQDHFSCHSIVDERSAAYVALGMARQLDEPVVILTTSGTAVLNLSPALAEAYKQGIPLVVLTADRPLERISNFNNQVFDQRAPYFNFSKGFLELPPQFWEREELEKSMDSARMLFREALAEPCGPVHLNLPLLEPLYEVLPGPELSDMAFREPGIISDSGPDPRPYFAEAAKKVMILAGMGKGDQDLIRALEELPAVVVAENISNLASEKFISVPELVLAGASAEERQMLMPDLVISFGRQVVSRRLRIFLQSQEDLEIMELQQRGPELAALVREWARQAAADSSFRGLWKELEQRACGNAQTYLGKAEFGNLSAVIRVLDAVPSGTVVHLGNSATIRMSQLVRARADLQYYSNRGISGIDGSLSTAVGAALVSDQEHLLILGDLSFVYDSNGLWNKDFPSNLKIVVLNDGGGGIFRLLDGPDRMDFFEEFSVTHHPVSLELLSSAYGRRVSRATNMTELEQFIPALCSPGQSMNVLEIDTTGSDNRRIFKDLFT